MRKTFLQTHLSRSIKKMAPKKRLILEKRENFENCQKWPQCKGYSPCKMGRLGQKIKLPKIFETRYYKRI